MLTPGNNITVVLMAKIEVVVVEVGSIAEEEVVAATTLREKKRHNESDMLSM